MIVHDYARVALLCGILCFGCPIAALGQLASPTTPSLVSAAGTAEVTKVPELIRLQIKQYGKGSDTEAARVALLGAQKKLIKSMQETGTEIVVATAGAAMSSPYRSRYNNDLQMIQQRRQAAGGGGFQPIDPNKPIPIILERWVVLDLKPSNKQKEIMTVVLDIQEKLRKEQAELTGMSAMWSEDGAAEVPREMWQRGDFYMNQQDVHLQLAARITKQDRQHLFTVAFQRARANAQELAEAASAKLSRIHTLSSSSQEVMGQYPTNPGFGALILSSGEVLNRSPFKDESGEDISILRSVGFSQAGQFTPLTYQVRLNVSYVLDFSK